MLFDFLFLFVCLFSCIDLRVLWWVDCMESCQEERVDWRRKLLLYYWRNEQGKDFAGEALFIFNKN